MLLTNCWRISFTCNKILNKKSIQWLFQNKTGFYFWFGEHKSQEQKKAVTWKGQHVFSVQHTGGNDCQQGLQWSQGTIQRKKHNPRSQTLQQLSPSFVPSHHPQVPLRTGCPAGTALAVLFEKAGGHLCWDVTTPAADPSVFPLPDVSGTPGKLRIRVSLLCAGLEARRWCDGYASGTSWREDARFAFLIARAVVLQVSLSSTFSSASSFLKDD